MPKLTRISWRIGLIVVIGLVATMLVPIALLYSAQSLDRVSDLPSPRQLAAMVSLIETTPPAQHAAIFEAFRSTQLNLHVAPDAEVDIGLAPFWPNAPNPVADYENALDGREFGAYSVRRQPFKRGRFDTVRIAELRVALRTGGVLSVAAEDVVLFWSGGMPIGFPVAFAGMLVAFVALILLNREFRPILRLAKAVEALDPSDQKARLPKIGANTREVQALVKAFDRQQERVSTLLRARATLIGGIQHDVRTFATRLRLRIEKLPDETERSRAESEIADLITLMDSALLATRSEVRELNLELIDVQDFFVKEILARAAPDFPVQLTIEETAKSAQVLADRLALKRIVLNVVENAIRYGKAARVGVSAQGQTLTLRVDDDGPGIPQDQRAALLEPFARQEPSRSRQTGGAGLGLAIVKSLVEGHQGGLSIKDAPSGGARIVITLPQFVA
jgi:signal transduction histidine kinase